MDKRKGYLCILITTILFSSMEIALKLSAGEFHPIQITMGRFLVGGLVLIPFAVSALKKRGKRISAYDMKWFALLGFIGILTSMTLYQLSILYIEASKVAVLFSSNPLFVTIFAVVLLKEPLLKHKVIAVIGDLLGIIFIVQPWAPGLNVAGIVFVMASAVLFALYGVLGKSESRKLGGVTLTCGSFLLASAEMMALAALTHVEGVSRFLAGHGLESFVQIPFIRGFSSDNILIFLYIAVFATGIGYAAYFMAMEYVSAQEASMVFFFKPVLATVAAALILGEQVPAAMILGIGLILAGSLVSMAGDRKLAGTEDRTPVGTEDRAPAATEDCTPAVTEDCAPVGTEDRMSAATENRTPVGAEGTGQTAAESLGEKIREELHETEEAAEEILEDNGI